VEQFSAEVQRRAGEIAKKYKRQLRNILFRAHLGLRLSRKDNSYCQYRVWHAQRHPIPKGSQCCSSCVSGFHSR
jgi:hypothetical protein